MNIRMMVSKSPWPFFILGFILSVPFWIIGAIPNPLSKIIPIDLPISALMFIIPITTALMLARKENKTDGMKELLKRVFDYKRITNKAWYIPVIFFMPAVMILSYGVMRLIGRPLPDPQIPFLMIPVFLIAFFIGAIGEEVGWSGYAIDPLQNRWSALKAAIILGLVWAIWHIIPFFQTRHTAAWVFWQFMSTIVLRIIMVWLYNNTGKSVFAMILFHDMINVSNFLFPNYGSHYDPFITGTIFAITAVIITFVWGPKTLARYRYARSSEPEIEN